MENNYLKLFERKNSLFVFCISLWAHSFLLKNATGQGFINILFEYQDDFGIMLAKARDLESLKEYYRKLIQNDSRKLYDCYELAKKVNTEADQVISQFKNTKALFGLDKFKNHLE